MDGRLTPDDVKALNRPFEVAEHEFKGVYVYVAEAAVCDRLESVDPSWSLEIVSNEIREDRAEQYAVCHARLTVNGVRREGVGMQTHNRDEKKILPTELEKGAATDALRRCARLFGVGRYLLKAPRVVKDKRSLTAWLETLNNIPAPAASTNGHQADAERTWPHPTLIEEVKQKAMRVFDIKVWSDEFLCGKKWSDFESGRAAGLAIADCVNGLEPLTPEVQEAVEASGETVTTASGEPVDPATGEILTPPVVESGKSPFDKVDITPEIKRLECKAEHVAVGDVLREHNGRSDRDFEVLRKNAVKRDANGKHYPCKVRWLDTSKLNDYVLRVSENGFMFQVVGGPKLALDHAGGHVEKHNAGHWTWTPAKEAAQ